jgi:uncharacterized protein (TIGR03085 family)
MAETVWLVGYPLLAGLGGLGWCAAGDAPGTGVKAVAYHRRMTYARDERTALCSLLDDLGPAAPTLCDGWSTRDLAAHLVIREHRPDAGGGLVGRGPLAGYTRRVQGKRAERTPFPRLVEILRQGPPRLSLFGLPRADELINTVEFFVHHEDVRRAQPDWQPRTLDPGLADELWRRLRSARFFLRKVPVGLEFAREDAPVPAGGRYSTGRVRIIAKARTPVVTVIGPPAELTMWAMGRTSAARVRFDGSPAAVQALASPAWRGRQAAH